MNLSLPSPSSPNFPCLFIICLCPALETFSSYNASIYFRPAPSPFFFFRLRWAQLYHREGFKYYFAPQSLRIFTQRGMGVPPKYATSFSAKLNSTKKLFTLKRVLFCPKTQCLTPFSLVLALVSPILAFVGRFLTLFKTPFLALVGEIFLGSKWRTFR